MADEPRRSGRATKGQHTKNNDVDSQSSKRKGKAQAKAAKQKPSEPTPPAAEEQEEEEEEEEEIIRCICGEYEEEEDVERDMICCDQCSAWQHNDCMGLRFAKGQEPDEYYCEQCKPENHKELLDKMARGEKPWEEAARIREQQAKGKKGRRKKGGKRGRKPRVSEAKSEMSEAASGSAAPTPSRDASHPVPENQPEAPATASPTEPSSSQKRKFGSQGDSATQDPEPKSKHQRVSTGGTPSQRRGSSVQERKPSMTATPSTKAQTAEALTGARSSAATALSKLVGEQVAIAQKEGTFTLPSGQTNDGFAESLGSAIERSMYERICGGSGQPNDAYKQQLRTIRFNVAKNPSLRDNLLVGSVTPDGISTMSTHDMASKELRQKEDEIKREADRQHVIVQETGPRIRRTHKGEEIVESDSHLVGNESVFSTAPTGRGSVTGSQQAHASMSPGGASPTTAHRPEFGEVAETADSSSRAQRPHPIDTQISQEGGRRRTSSGNFDIQGVWSSVRSPGAGGHHDQVFGQAYPEQPPPSGNKVQDDAEIDQLLKEDDVESPPYSPKDFHADGIIWRGKVAMEPHVDFSASARHVGGADLSGRMPWSQMLPSRILIEGRIETHLANNYLCGLRYSNSTDITVVAISPPNTRDDLAQFNRLFDYFVERDRYGVIEKNHRQPIKDTYLLPVEAGSGKKPEIIGLLENNAVEDPTPERLLLVIFVVKTGATSGTPSSQQTPLDLPQSAVGSPLTTNSGAAPYSQAAQPESATGYNPTSQLNQLPYLPAQSYQSQAAAGGGGGGQELTGAAAASQILGSYTTAPAIQQVLQQAPNATASQFRLVASILADNPAAANDYQTLMTAIAQAQGGAPAP